MVVDEDGRHAGQDRLGLHAEVGHDEAAGRVCGELGADRIGPRALAATDDAHEGRAARGEREGAREQRAGREPVGVVVAEDDRPPGSEAGHGLGEDAAQGGQVGDGPAP